MDLINSKQVKYATVKSVIILGGMVAHISSPISALQKRVSYTLATVGNCEVGKATVVSLRLAVLMPCHVKSSCHTTPSSVMSWCATPMQSYDISWHACQCDTAWCAMHSRSLDRHVRQPST